MTVARQYHTFQIHYLVKTINFNDPGVAAGIPMDGRLPKNSIDLPLTIFVETAFNAATTNVILVGDGTTANRFAQSGDSTPGTIGKYINVNRNTVRPAVDLDVLVAYTQTGAAATAGKATVILPFIPDQTQY